MPVEETTAGVTRSRPKMGPGPTSACANASAFLVLAALLLAGCAKTPPEVVQLSTVLGEDLVSTQTSYQLLISSHYESLRERVNTFVDTRWRPVFLKKFIQDGSLVERATGPNPDQVLTRVGNWVTVAIEQIEAKREELLAPIDSDEKALKVAVDEAFNRMIQANTTITAHLNSIRKVKEFQDKILQAAGVKDLRDKINEALITASNQTQKAIQRVAETEGMIDDLSQR